MAISREEDLTTFRMNEKSLKDRIGNLKKAKLDTREEEQALQVLQEAIK